MTWLLLLAAIVGGTANPFQSGINAELNKQIGNPFWATVFVYAVGLGGLLFLQLLLRQPLQADKLGSAPWWAWLGAPISLVSTFIALTLAQKMGSATFTGVTVTASLLTSVVLDHFGLIGLKTHLASPARLAGCILMIVGLWVVARF